HRRSRRPLSVLIGAGVGIVALAALVILGLRAAAGPTAPPTAAPTTAASAAAPVSPDQRWFIRAPMIKPRDSFALAAYDPERKLYVIGGRRGGSVSAAVDRYDPASDRWVSLADKPTAVSDAGAIMLQGDIYVPGGEDASGRVRDSLEIYNPRDQQWEQGSPMPAPRSRYALVAWEGRLYVIGGWDGERARSEVFIYNPELKAWSEGPSLSTPRQGAGSIAAAGRIFVIGGSNEGGALRESLRLDPTGEGAAWERIAPLPDQGVSQPGVVAPVETILVFDPGRRRGFQYDQASDTWADFAIPDGVTISSKAVLLGPSIYLIDAGAAPSLGAMSEYQAVYTIFIPSR
ncbi:LuxR family transcriptional regulator, partial [Oscillochloris sp. ZM17-4]|uniref:Kelch repeat-containing protein n=1 Tax=Oscillochloris sp. ZM17-4 TaxID=2866714 RepID=UPI001C73A0EE